MNDYGMHKLKGPFFLNFPTAELMSLVRVSITLDLFVDAHEFESLLHLGQTGPVLYVGFRAFLFGFM
jgi:hypothetical protein